MNLDYYDGDLEEWKPTLLESWRENKGTYFTVAKIVAIPTCAFILSCAFNYWLKKKLGPL